MTSSTDRAGASPDSGGFTLLELLVVVAIAALAVAVVAPRLVGPPGVSVATAARDVAAGLRAARGEALRSGRAVAVAIDPARAGLGPADRPVPLVLPPGATLELVRPAVPSGTAAAAPAVRFFPDGSATPLDLRLAAGSQTARVVVEAYGGRIAIERGGAGR